MISPIRYPGGKSKLKKYFVNMFPKKEEVTNVYDLFIGGGSITLYFAENGYKNIYANDINKALINLHSNKGVNYDMLKILFSFEDTDINRDIFNYDFKDKDDPNYFFIKNKMGFSGLQKSSFSPQASIKNANIKSVERLEEMHNVYKNNNVEFYSSSFELLQIKDNSFIFADPPYYSNGKKELYNGTHEVFPHDKLYSFLKKEDEKGNKFMITYDDCEEIREMYKEYNIKTFTASYSMTNTGGNNCKLGNEIIITNY